MNAASEPDVSVEGWKRDAIDNIAGIICQGESCDTFLCQRLAEMVVEGVLDSHVGINRHIRAQGIRALHVHGSKMDVLFSVRQRVADWLSRQADAIDGGAL